MRHRKSGRKLNRNSSHRNAMFRNMVTSLFKHDRIRTTDAKAKELRSLADRLVTLAKRGDLHARRQALSIIREKDVVHKLFEEAGERFGESAGGYTRIVKIGRRPGDAAPLSIIELVTPEGGKKKKKTTKKKAKPAPKATKTPAEKPEDEAQKTPQEEADETKSASAGDTDVPASPEAGDDETTSDGDATEPEAAAKDTESPEDTAEAGAAVSAEEPSETSKEK